MLTYDADDDWENWNGGFWGKEDDYDEERNVGCLNGCIRCCCKGYCRCVWCCCCVFLLLLCGGAVALYMFADPRQIICSNGIKIMNCGDDGVGGVNGTVGVGVTEFWNQTNISNMSISNMSISNGSISNGSISNTSDIFPNQNINNDKNELGRTDVVERDKEVKNIYNNTDFLNTTQLMTAENLDVIRSGLNKNSGMGEKREATDTGVAVAISISSVFGFIFLLIGIGSCIKYRGKIYNHAKRCNCNYVCNCKQYFTNLTASKGVDLKIKEIKDIENGGTINPMLKIFQPKDCDCKIKEMSQNPENNMFVKGVREIKKAIEKDNGHYYEEAIDLYNKGIDCLMVHMKTMNNARDRFALAKKMDVYLKRVHHLNNLVENKKIYLDMNQKNA